jgi:hypothetical protein
MTKINIETNYSSQPTLGSLNAGAIFCRNGYTYILVVVADGLTPDDCIAAANLETGEMWYIKKNTTNFSVVNNVVISGTIE